MSSTNVVRDTTGSDYLNNLRLTDQSIQAGNTAQTNYTPLYIIQEGDVVDITDSVSNNGNQQSQADTIDITDSVSETNQNTGTFLIDTAKIGFADLA